MCLQPLGKSLDTIGEGKMPHKCPFIVPSSQRKNRSDLMQELCDCN